MITYSPDASRPELRVLEPEDDTRIFKPSLAVGRLVLDTLALWDVLRRCLLETWTGRPEAVLTTLLAVCAATLSLRVPLLVLRQEADERRLHVSRALGEQV